MVWTETFVKWEERNGRRRGTSRRGRIGRRWNREAVRRIMSEEKVV